MFRIGEFSKLSNVTIKMLRYYDEIELLCPSKIDNESNYRYYSYDKLEIASKINFYRGLGFSLKIIKKLLETPNDFEQVKSYLLIREVEIKEEQEKLNRQIALINKIAEGSENMNKTKYNPIIKKIPKRLVISLRRIVSCYDDEKILWNELYEYINTNGLKPIYDGYTMAIYHDKEYKEKENDIEVQVTINSKDLDNYIPNDFIKIISTDEYDVVSLTFAGSYEQMPKVTESLAYYFESNNLNFSSEMINIFHVSPAQTDNENEYVTESCYKIDKVV